MSQTTLIITLVIVVIIAIFGGYLYYKKYISPSGSTPAPLVPVFSKEIRLDTTIPKPPKPILANFEGMKNNPSRPNPSLNNGYPWCSPTWYAFRYVDPKLGNYGPLSEWSGPIRAGAQLVDMSSSCLKGVCNFPIDQKVGTCGFNNITIGTDQDLGSLVPQVGSFTLMVNVHRQTDNFNPNASGDIIGQIYPSKAYGMEWAIQDVQAPLKTKQRKCASC